MSPSGATSAEAEAGSLCGSRQVGVDLVERACRIPFLTIAEMFVQLVDEVASPCRLAAGAAETVDTDRHGAHELVVAKTLDDAANRDPQVAVVPGGLDDAGFKLGVIGPVRGQSSAGRKKCGKHRRPRQ